MALKTALRVVTALRKSYWRILKPLTVGVKIIVVQDGRVLLIKNQYDKFWYLPGGGVKKGETLAEAASREILEETSLEITSLRLLGAYSNFQEGKNDHILLFEAAAKNNATLKNGFEVEKHLFIDPNNPPEMTSPATLRRLEEYLHSNYKNGQW